MNNLSIDHDSLQEISQFVSQLKNSLIASNDDFAKSIGFTPETFESFKELWIEDLRGYKVYDC